LLVPTCVAGDVETVATEGDIPSEAAATVTECSGSDWCECDWYNQESVGRINGVEKCVKCPDGMRQLDYSVPTCYSCPTGQEGPYSSISGPKCFDECADGATMVPKLVPSIVTSDKLRCFKEPPPAQTTEPRTEALGVPIPSCSPKTNTNAPAPAPAPPTTTPAPAVAEVAPADSKFFVTMTVTMPFSKSDFVEDKQDKYKAAIASAAGAPVDNVDIVSITEKRRRAGSVDVETKIRAKDESGMTALSEALGSGDALKTKINSALDAQGLPASTGVTAPAKAVIDVSSAGASQSPLWALAVLAAAGAAAF